jgi:membrane protein implicated in regulation of membrane protease activity
MNWELFYLICFVVGFAFTAVSFLSGTLHFHFHLPHGNFHGAGHAGHAGGTSHGQGGSFPVFNPMTIAVFLAWFGGAGYLAVHFRHIWVFAGLVIATLAGLVGASIVFLFAAKYLMAHEHTMDPADYEMTGVLGRISGTIRKGGTGEIIFEQEGARKACAARSEEQQELKRGEEVIVTRFDKGVAYVRRWSDMAGEVGILPEEEEKSL